MDERIIGHIDMDAFFASVEERDHPWLQGVPLVIGSDPKGGEGRGVVSTANYMAREYGIHSALPIQKAWQLSEEAAAQGKKRAVFMTPRGRRYGEVSKKVFLILEKYVESIQVTSVDEAYFDITKAGSFTSAQGVAKNIQQEILEALQLSCSIGLGPNKMIAKIASDYEKPHGLTVVPEDDVYLWLEPFSVRVIPGVGPKMQQQLRKLGIETIKDARMYGWEELHAQFGTHGFSLYQKVRGVGSTSLKNDTIRKSIGQHQTFSEDMDNLDFIRRALESMAVEIFDTLKHKGFKGFRTLTVTVRFSDFQTKNRSLTDAEVVTDLSTLSARAFKLLLPFFDSSENPQKKRIRMIGLRVEKLV